MIGHVLARGDGEPVHLSEVRMSRDAVFLDQHVGLDAGKRKVRDRVATGFVQEHDVVAVGDPAPPNRTLIRRRNGSANDKRSGNGCGLSN